MPLTSQNDPNTMKSIIAFWVVFAQQYFFTTVAYSPSIGYIVFQCYKNCYHDIC